MRADEAFAPLTSTAFELPDKTRAWLDDELPTDEYRSDVRAAFVDATETRDLVAELPEHDARELYLASAELYRQHAVVHLEAILLPPGEERDQTVLLARRLRELGDRIFDRGHYFVDPDFGADQTDAEINLPEEVPDWVAEGLAPGPPLEDEPPPPADTPPLREEERATQPEDEWDDAVEAAQAPAALDPNGDAADQARRYVAAAEALRDEPDPDVEHGREISAILRLSWLVKADAARAAQLGYPEVYEALDAIVVEPPA